MNWANAWLYVCVAAVSILSGCAAPDSIGASRSLSGEVQQPTVSGWKINFHESGSNPVIVDGVLYIGSGDGAVYALDPKTGETKWRFQTGENLSPATSFANVITAPRGTGIADQMTAGISAAERQMREGIRRVDMTPAVENGTVFIGAGDQSFHATDAATGKKKWSYVAGPGMVSSNFLSITRPAAVLKNGTVYFVTEDGLHAIDALTGKRKWLFETLQEIPRNKYMPRKRVPTGPVMGDSAFLLTAWPYILGATPRKSFVYAVDPESGNAKWVVSVDGTDISAPTTAKGLVFFAVKEGPQHNPSPLNRDKLYAIDAADGQVKWKFDAESSYGTPQLLIAAGATYFSNNKSLFALELDTGRQLWSFSASEIRANLQTDDQHLYIVTHKGTMARPDDTLHALALTTGQKKWSRDLSGNARVAMVQDGVVYAGTQAFDAATGNTLWSFRGTGRESVRLISGGRMFLTSPTVTYIQSTRVDQGYLYAIDARTGKLEP